MSYQICYLFQNKLKINTLLQQSQYLLNSTNLDELDKDKLSKTIDVSFLRQLENSDYLTSSLRTFANVLYKEYNKHPILLIDEYDVPL